MRIHFERTGGFMGRKVTLDLDTADLPEQELESLRQILAEANFFDLPDNLVTRPVPDEFQYNITVTTETIIHTVRTSDAASPPSLSALVQYLNQESRKRREG